MWERWAWKWHDWGQFKQALFTGESETMQCQMCPQGKPFRQWCLQALLWELSRANIFGWHGDERWWIDEMRHTMVLTHQCLQLFQKLVASARGEIKPTLRGMPTTRCTHMVSCSRDYLDQATLLEGLPITKSTLMGVQSSLLMVLASPSKHCYFIWTVILCPKSWRNSFPEGGGQPRRSAIGLMATTVSTS